VTSQALSVAVFGSYELLTVGTASVHRLILITSRKQRSLCEPYPSLVCCSSYTQDVVDFLKDHLDDVITEVHSLGKLLVDDGNTSINAPPAPEAGDNHGGLLIRTISEKVSEDHPILAREFKVRNNTYI
jgi:hypothetical protein